MAASDLDFVLISFGILIWRFKLDPASIGADELSTTPSRAPRSKGFQALSSYFSQFWLLVRG
ncbi:MAG: hypothetical protein ACRD4F_07715, partial [Candidatus Angelobacter sp.]